MDIAPESRRRSAAGRTESLSTLSLRGLAFAVPLALTAARIVAVPFTLWLIVARSFEPAFWLFTVAGLTDALDGALARFWNVRTLIGGYLDPAADKLLLVGTYVTLGFLGLAPIWLVTLVVARDVLIVLGVVALSLAGLRPTISPLAISKLNSFVQIILAGWLLGSTAWNIIAPGITITLTAVVTATTLLSFYGYARAWGRRRFQMELS